MPASVIGRKDAGNGRSPSLPSGRRWSHGEAGGVAQRHPIVSPMAYTYDPVGQQGHFP